MNDKIKLTRKQKKFADGILEGKPKYLAAIDAYDIKTQKNEMSTGGAIATENLNKPKIIAYLEEQGYGAATRIVELSKRAENETVKLNANKDILDRVNVGVKQPINAFQFNFNKVRDEYA